MWGENSKNCDNCDCSGLITEKFRINSGNNATKRKQEDSVTINYKTKMNPHTLNFASSPNSPVYTAGKRRILGQLQLTESPLERLKSPMMIPAKLKLSPLAQASSPLQKHSPLLNKTSPLATHSPLTTKNKRSRISKVLEERTRFKSSNKENEPSILSETFVKLDQDEEARDYLFGKQFSSSWRSNKKLSMTKLDFSHAVPSSSRDSFVPTMPSSSRDLFSMPSPKQDSLLTFPSPKHDSLIFPSPKQDSLIFPSPKQDSFVPEKEVSQDFEDFEEDLHDLEEEFETNFDECTKYEIISTDSPNIISRGRTTSTRKVTSRNFVFGAPLSENEPSTSFNKPNITVTRMLTFEEDDFDFTSPAVKKAVKKSLDFSEESKLRIEQSDSSIGSMSLSQTSPKPNYYTSESIESGFVSELSQLSQPFLEAENSHSPKVENLIDLISGQIKSKDSEQTFVRRPLNRSISLNPDSRVRTSLFSILENPERRTFKRMERSEMEVSNKRRKANCLSQSPVVKKSEKIQRPVLMRAFSENNAAIMSAMDRSMLNEDLIADFSVPFALPLISGDHLDLKSISSDTLASLLKGVYDETISDFQVIDCRYPYEYEGGHIMNAVNFYTPDQVQGLINKPRLNTDPTKRSILVFHCEFSIERGPKLFRYLRSSDRLDNKDRYPHLHYPEVYLLHSGYKSFYEKYPELCSPSGYTAMMDPLHKSSLRIHRTK